MFRIPQPSREDREADEDSLAFALVAGNNGRVWESLLMLSRWRQEHFIKHSAALSLCILPKSTITGGARVGWQRAVGPALGNRNPTQMFPGPVQVEESTERRTDLAQLTLTSPSPKGVLASSCHCWR